MSRFIAHVRQTEDGQWLEHALQDHLSAVAQLAGCFATTFSSSDWAYLAGLWHDLGKYRPEFQKYIRTASGYDLDAHIETTRGKVDHSTAGAIHACQQLGHAGRILAYLIAGHHAGLPDWDGDQAGASVLSVRLRKEELLQGALSQNIPDPIQNPPKPATKPSKGADPAFWIRMLFSCLVDADFLDTEAFMDPQKAADRQGYAALTQLLTVFDEYMTQIGQGAEPTVVNRVRAEVLNRCREQAEQPPGLFSLTVPTGGGKTLSSLAFALRHAVKHGKRRIIYVIPYTSIIEQTADVFRRIFGNDVLEHHSNLDSTDETARSRVACENWDAPLIVTTSVQFFESLFACRTSRVRKLHNIVNSVVVLDEAQLLPPDFLRPILRSIQELSRYYGVSMVLCTATQPALGRYNTFDFKLDEGLDGVREITASPIELHDRLRRVAVKLPADLHETETWESLAGRLQNHETVLCVVDRRDDCRTLHQLMPQGTLHLSGLMCGQHRSAVIAEIKNRLCNKEPVRVISTQLIEAGVDVDFPVVYRALAGLDSIAQAAGRCNREGKLPELGQVVVFVPPKPAPVGHLRQAQDCGRQMLLQGLADPLAPEHFIPYFRQLYWGKGDGLDRHDVLTDLKPNKHLEFLFSSAARKFRIID
ncbi:MAG: CRISPR-associated endonuclease Cas3'', partial [Candidatus Competibacteraceae bacterium]|nr:CRISPR-associated endonuclease Cas3'' [Candidatus Competibacteraceae bacterium]